MECVADLHPDFPNIDTAGPDGNTVSGNTGSGSGLGGNVGQGGVNGSGMGCLDINGVLYPCGSDHDDGDGSEGGGSGGSGGNNGGGCCTTSKPPIPTLTSTNWPTGPDYTGTQCASTPQSYVTEAATSARPTSSVCRQRRTCPPRVPMERRPAPARAKSASALPPTPGAERSASTHCDITDSIDTCSGYSNFDCGGGRRMDWNLNFLRYSSKKYDQTVGMASINHYSFS